MRVLFLISIFVVSTCGLIYELITGTLASYLLGDSVTQFSTVIGVYLFSMGIGSYISKFVRTHLVRLFVQVEILVGLVGGLSAGTLFLCFEHVSSFRTVLYGLLSIVGILVGLEIPLIMRILHDEVDFRELVAKVFTFDYVGALVASLLFPLLLVPHLGLIRTSLMFGICNVVVALASMKVFKLSGRSHRALRHSGWMVLGILIAAFIFAGKILSLAEAGMYPDPVVFAESTPYQRILITQKNSDLRLFLNGNLQFSSRDEYRYHEALVHFGLAGLKTRKKILVLGGGDGLAVREILKYPEVESVTLVDLDGEMTHLFSTRAELLTLNQQAFKNPKVQIVHADAFAWIRESREIFDFVVIDFPDPSNFSLGKLFSTTFFKALRARLAPEGRFVVQSTSPLVARKSYWCIDATIRAVGFKTLPYHALVPSFGEWGFILAGWETPVPPTQLPADVHFLNLEVVRQLASFPPDMARVQTEINQLNSQALVHYFDEEWAEYAH